MTNPNLWNQLLIWPIVNVLVALYKLFEWLHIPGPFGFAILVLTILLRIILYPLMQAQLKSARKMQKLKPHLDALNTKHKDNKQALQQAQLALYKEHGVNPAAGCLPLLIQMPVLIALYNVFYQVLQNGNAVKLVSEINHVVYWAQLKITALDLSFFGTSLGVKPNQWQTHGWWLLMIPVITAGLQYWQSKLMMPPSPADSEGKPPGQKEIIKASEKKEQSPEDTAMEMQKQMMMIMPVMYAVFAYQFPLGLALYWNVFGLFGIMQQLAVNKET